MYHRMSFYGLLFPMPQTSHITRRLLFSIFVTIIIVIACFVTITLTTGDKITEKLSDSRPNNNSDFLLEQKNIEHQPDLNDPAKISKNIYSNSQDLETTGLVTVNGKISDNNDKGISGIQVEISSTAVTVTPKKIHAAITDGIGNFTITHVPEGNDYRLEILALGAFAGTVIEQLKVEPYMKPLAVALDSLDLVSIDGTIVGTDYLPITDFEILVRNIGIAYPGDRIVTNNEGLFHLSQFPAGDIQLATNGDEHFEITGITLSPGEYRNMTLVLDKGVHGLSGNVVDSFGQPIEQARVVASSHFSGGHYQSSSYRLKVTDSNGYFSFTKLGDWDRRLVVDATGYQTNTLRYSFQTQNDILTVQLLTNP